jgi:hypothetical protein
MNRESGQKGTRFLSFSHFPHRQQTAVATTMAAVVEPTTGTTAIEALFRLTITENQIGFELLPGLTVDDILATGNSWEDLCFFLHGKVLLITPDVFICSRGISLGEPVVLVIGDDVNDWENNLCVHVTSGVADAVATATCHFLLRLLATSEKPDVYMRGQNSWVASPLSGAGLSLFFQECPSCLCRVTLDYMALSEDHCRALATMSRLDVEVKISKCRVIGDAAELAFVECLQSETGRIQLIGCTIRSQILASALAGKSRVTKLVMPAVNWSTINEAVMAFLFTALANNRGLLDLDLRRQSINDENWTILCESLKAHPTLLILNLPSSHARLSDKRTTNRTRLLAEMVQQNTVLHTIRLSERERDEQIYTQEIRPYLEVNLYRPRVLAVKKTTERPFREKVLGRALYSVKSGPNLVWMFLSENVDAFARSEEEAEQSNDEVEVAVAVAVAVEEAVAVACSKRKR